MQLGLIGLGKMGGNMRERLRRGGHTVIGYDTNPEISDAKDLPDLVAQLGDSPRVVWVMVPAGAITDSVIDHLGALLAPGDIIIDGGNSKWTADKRHADELATKGIRFLDCGVSGGVWGLENGYALMCGGAEDAVEHVMPVFEALKPEGEFGFVHAGEVGAGHFAKMVHNGIEYGLMQAYAEGWELLEKADIVTHVPAVFESWREGTVIRSWLLDLMVRAMDADPHLDQIEGYAADFRVTQEILIHSGGLAWPEPLADLSLAALVTLLRPHHDRLLGPRGVLAPAALDLPAQKRLAVLANLTDLVAHRLLIAETRARAAGVPARAAEAAEV